MRKEDVPACLVRAREEVLFALKATTAEESLEHKQIADGYIKRAVLDLQRHPRRKHDWSILTRH